MLPFGGVTIFNEDLNRPIYEEFIILIMGPVFQIVFSFFIIEIVALGNKENSCIRQEFSLF